MDKSRISQELEQLLNLYIEQHTSPALSNMLEKSLVSKMQDENAAKIIISYTNKLLGVLINRSKGLGLLDKVIVHCPIAVLMDNAITWTNICVNYSSKEPLTMLRFTVLVKILQTCSGTPDYNKSVMQLLPKIIDMCLLINPDQFLTEGSLECLKICLQKYPSTCGPFKNKIESHLIKYMTCLLPPTIMEKAGSVFHYLQQVGGSGPEGITHKNNWSNHLKKLCSTMHKLYNKFFERVTEFENKDMDVVPFEFPQLTDQHNINSVPYLTGNVLKNIVIFINCMLVEYFPVEKSIAMYHILDVIKRGLLVDTYTDFEKSIEDTQFAALLYSHQIDLLYLLRSLIACFKQNVVPFSFTITKLLTDCLQRTQKNYFKSSSEYQGAVYKVLNYWIIITGSKLNNTMHNKLITLIISEITPAKSNVVLCLNESLRGKKGKGKKKTVQEPAKIDENVVKETQKLLEIKEKNCSEALKTGKTLLQQVMLQLDQDTYKIVFQTIIQHLLNIQGGKIIHPYANPKCQAYLYEMLASILLQPTFCMSPLLQIAINIFTRGQNRSVNSNDSIFLACAKGLNVLEKLCQATCPTMHINNFVQDDELKKNSKKRACVIEEDDVGVNGFNGNEVENPEPTNEIAQIFSQKDYSNSPKRIRVLDHQIIQTASNNSKTHDENQIDRSDHVYAARNNVTKEEDVPEEEEEQQNVMTKMEETEEALITQDNLEQQWGLFENGDIPKLFKEEIQIEIITPVEISVTCENNIDRDEADMLNSFHDVLSQ